MYFCSSDLTFADSLLVLFVGMAITFLALAILVVAVIAYAKFFKLFDKKGNKKPVSVPNEAAEESESEISTDADAEIVAAITAAISMMYAAESEDGEVPPFRVKSIILN